MRKKNVCFNCGAIVVKDVISLHRKLFSNNVDRFFCLACLAEYLECTEEGLRELITNLKEQGCVYFK
ncbi:biotin operon repressor [Carboxydothermus ferrireducens DSM 11255]|uniref:Biotin operon repressor n=1 Tax=Carboxydothermus ferrireducens DSM 11255 TaxID=1119529 RepID=A0ABX2RCD4_9THEO|nr:biotin operon repressor [Carboxydothermus ferrireducens DSM 11255]